MVYLSFFMILCVFVVAVHHMHTLVPAKTATHVTANTETQVPVSKGTLG